MKLTIHDKEVDFQYKLMSDMIFENIQGHSFKGDSETDWVVYMYSSYLANTKDYETDLETFISYLDENLTNFYAFISWYTKFMTNQMKLIPKDKEQDSSKKKVVKKTVKKSLK